MELIITNTTRKALEPLKIDFHKLAHGVFLVTNKNASHVFFELIFVSKNRIRFLNLTYRKIDKVTDVISFAFNDNLSEGGPRNNLGEIDICYDVAVLQAKKYQHSLRREIAFLFVHGLLHLLGYDHQNEEEAAIMFGIQKQIVGKMI
ncbi:MAG: rRNA maturation RNase YbeY [Erysipelotrichaceae bacterium]|nr:rRNA maturation RNase YbeY [Erysipelotrichaceae bacterium]